MEIKIPGFIRIIAYSLAIAVPILAMANCTGWGTNDMKVDQCFIDTPFLRDLSQNCYSILFFSSFLFGLPIAVYAAVVFLLVEIPLFLFSKKRKKQCIDSIKRTMSDVETTIKKENISPFVIIPFAALGFIVLLVILSR